MYGTENLDITSAAFWLQLPEPCVTALFQRTKAHKEMLQAITKNGFALESFKKLMAHMCYENREFSVRTAKFILKGTNQGSYEEAPAFLDIMRQFLLINDSLRD